LDVESVPQRHSHAVPAQGHGQRLDRFLTDLPLGLSRSQLKRLIDDGFVEVEGRPAKAGLKLKEGWSLVVTVPDPEPTRLVPEAGVRFAILYQDAELIVVDKPAGLVVHPAAGHRTGTLVHGLLAACTDLAGIGGEVRPGIVHRLDKDTSGVMIVAKTDRAHQDLAAQFKAGRVLKLYLGLCRGRTGLDQGVIEASIGRHPVWRKQMSTRSRSGRPAITRYEVLRRFDLGVSLLRLRLLTGRTHQIRVHLASIGCPILGDPVYGVGLGGLKDGGRLLRGLVARQMLHAQTIGFCHPVTREEMSFTSPLPEDMTRVLETLERCEAAPARK
jgi:23S rRNA pseudouridine1911/1915/1917 synthase